MHFLCENNHAASQCKRENLQNSRISYVTSLYSIVFGFLQIGNSSLTYILCIKCIVIFHHLAAPLGWGMRVS